MYDVIVIGGGIAGAATAYFLAADGVSTLLLERYDLNTQASGSNAGGLHGQIPFEPFAQEGDEWLEAFSPVIGLLTEAVALWRELPAMLRVDLEVALTGGLIVAATDSDMRLLERKAEVERRHGLDVEILDRETLRDFAPYLADSMLGGAFCANEGNANPLRATPAFAARARQLGATVRTQTNVVGLSRRSGGGYSVHTDRGDFECVRVINAAGADAGRVAGMLGVQLHVAGEPIQASVTERVAPLIPHLVYFTGAMLTLKQTAQGTLIIGGGWPAALDPLQRPVVAADSLARNLAVAVDVVPALASVHVMRSWAGMVNGTHDWKPILGECAGVPGFYIVFFPWLGFTAGPLAGRIAASLVQGKQPPTAADVRLFRP
jgi:glycine/D-amino acid oxidase-like deaminating enzyme